MLTFNSTPLCYSLVSISRSHPRIKLPEIHQRRSVMKEAKTNKDSALEIEKMKARIVFISRSEVSPDE